MSSSRISETQSSLGLQSYYSQQSVVPIGMQSQQQVVYGGGAGLSSSTSSSSTGFMSSPPQQQPEMRPTDQQLTPQGTVYPKRIFVGGIPAQTTEADLKLYFSQYGSVTETKIIQDRAGVSKGYGFVTFESADEVNKILAKDQQETLIFKDRKLNLGPAIRKNQLTPPGQPAPPQVIPYMLNSVPINSEGGQVIMLAPPMPMGDASYGTYQTAFPMLASGGQALYIQQPTYYMPQQQIAAGTINAIPIPANFQQQQHQQHQQHQQPQQHHIHHQTANSLTAQQHQTQLRATPQSPPTPGGHPLIPVGCHYTPGGPSSTSVSDFYGADYEPIQSSSTDDNTSTWGSLSWGSQVATYPATSQVAPTGGLNLNRELDVAADPFTIPEAPSSTVQEIKQESSTIQNGVTSSGSGYVSSTSSNVSLYNNGSGSNNNNNNHSGESNQNEGFSGGYHKPASGGITGPDWSNF